MQMIQDGQYANAPEKPLRMTGTAESCRVGYIVCIKKRLPFLFRTIQFERCSFLIAVAFLYHFSTATSTVMISIVQYS